MGGMTTERMSYLLTMDNHRKKFPVVRWIEENIASGKADSDFGANCAEVIQEVTVRYTEEFDYEIIDGKVTRILTGWVSDRYFEDYSNPTKHELDLLEVCEDNHFKWLRLLCSDLELAFDKPHSCSIDYHIITEECSGAGCSKVGPVNYHCGKHWGYFCGSSPRCCP